MRYFSPPGMAPKLSARLWLPDGVALDADELRAPAVIEILPARPGRRRRGRHRRSLAELVPGGEISHRPCAADSVRRA